MDAPSKLYPFETAVLAVLFAAAICLPLARQLTVGEADISALEKRQLAPAPDFSLSSKLLVTGHWISLVKFLPQEIGDYFRDHFGFRRLLLTLNATICSKWLHYSHWAVIGRDGWLFYKINPPLFTQSLSNADLESWTSYLEHRQRWLAARGIKYLFVVAPEKDSIYQEFFPITSRPRPAVMPVDQLIQRLRETSSGVDILYLREPLLAAKKQEREPLYYKQDGHWNSLGAFYGYEAIMRHLANTFPALEAKSRTDYRLVIAKDDKRDIAFQAGLWDTPALQGPVLQPLTPGSARAQDLSLPAFHIDPLRTWMQDHAGLPRAVMLRDSFAIGLAPYLSESFSRITYFWPSVSNSITLEQEKTLADTILAEKPDIFIEEHVERFLAQAPDETIVFGDNEKNSPETGNP
jgi:alginate O-acetyltransferase complex protein AlgJ